MSCCQGSTPFERHAWIFQSLASTTSKTLVFDYWRERSINLKMNERLKTTRLNTSRLTSIVNPEFWIVDLRENAAHRYGIRSRILITKKLGTGRHVGYLDGTGKELWARGALRGWRRGGSFVAEERPLPGELHTLGSPDLWTSSLSTFHFPTFLASPCEVTWVEQWRAEFQPMAFT